MKSIKCYSIFVILLLFISTAQAQRPLTFADEISFKNYVGTGFEYTANGYDELQNNPSFYDEKVLTRIIVYLKRNTTAKLHSFHYRIKFDEITVKDKNAKEYKYSNSESNPLSFDVEYNSGNDVKYNDRTVFAIPDVYVVDISDDYTVYEVDQNGNLTQLSGSMDEENDIYIRVETDVERNSTFYPDIIPPVNFLENNITTWGIRTQIVTNGQELRIFWTDIPGADEYELEWTYYEVLDQNTVVNFENNATRIVTKDKEYKLPWVYDQGYFLFRHRGIAYRNGQRILGKWSEVNKNEDPYQNTYLDHNPQWILISNSFNNDINYTYEIGFAENGKNKSILKYYDGTGRQRQALTVSNKNLEAIVNEIIYDYYGRPAINVLPVPIGEKTYAYQHNLNRNSNGYPYSASDFDPGSNSGCNNPSAPMATTSGASKYYSTSNPVKTNENAYIPDATGYPFIQQEYEPDNTGRIRTQTLPGYDHRLGERNTGYIYGTPLQKELNRLFGTEAGWASHYKKNVVVDPNGQVSVSYLDMKGNVIATCLASTPPSNIVVPLKDAENEPLSHSGTITETLIKASTNSAADNINKIFYSKTLIPSSPGNIEFDYSLKIPKIIFNCATPTLIFEPVVHLDFSLTNICQDELLLTSDDPVKLTVGTESSTSTTDPVELGISSNSEFNTSNFSRFVQLDEINLTMPEALNLSKAITIDEEVLSRYVNTYMESSCAYQFDHFLSEPNLTLCDKVTCENCLTKLGSFNYFLENNFDKDSSEIVNEAGGAQQITLYHSYYDKLKNECKKLCDIPDECERRYALMITDMMPHGQYGQLTVETDPNTNEMTVSFPDNLSVFKESNELHSWNDNTPGWRHPYFIDEGGNSHAGYYSNDDVDQRAVIYLTKVNGSFFPLIVDNDNNPSTENTNIMEVEGEPGKYYAYPEKLEKLTDLLLYFNSDWAKSLVVYHPEYPFYRNCADNRGDATYTDERDDATVYNEVNYFEFLKTLSFSDAQYHGFLSLTNNLPGIYTKDPLFSNSALTGLDVTVDGGTYKIDNLMEYKLTSSKFMKICTSGSYLNISIYQAAYLAANFLPNQVPGTVLSNSGFSGIQFINDEKAWENFVNFYISLRQILFEKALETLANGDHACNDCIGNTVYSCLDQNNTKYPCNSTDDENYFKKARRFSNAERMINRSFGTDNASNTKDSFFKIRNLVSSEIISKITNHILLYDDNSYEGMFCVDLDKLVYGIRDSINKRSQCYCPIINDMLLLINYFNNFNDITSTLTLNANTLNNYITNKLYSEQIILNLSQVDFSVNSSDNKILTVNFVSSSTQYFMDFKIPDNILRQDSSEWNWSNSNIISIVKIDYRGYYGTTKLFRAILEIQSGNETRVIEVNGTTDLPFDNCAEKFVDYSFYLPHDDPNTIPSVEIIDFLGSLYSNSILDLSDFTGEITVTLDVNSYPSLGALLNYGGNGDLKFVYVNGTYQIINPASFNTYLEIGYYKFPSGEPFDLNDLPCFSSWFIYGYTPDGLPIIRFIVNMCNGYPYDFIDLVLIGKSITTGKVLHIGNLAEPCMPSDFVDFLMSKRGNSTYIPPNESSLLVNLHIPEKCKNEAAINGILLQRSLTQYFNSLKILRESFSDYFTANPGAIDDIKNVVYQDTMITASSDTTADTSVYYTKLTDLIDSINVYINGDAFPDQWYKFNYGNCDNNLDFNNSFFHTGHFIFVDKIKNFKIENAENGIYWYSFTATLTDGTETLITGQTCIPLDFCTQCTDTVFKSILTSPGFLLAEINTWHQAAVSNPGAHPYNDEMMFVDSRGCKQVVNFPPTMNSDIFYSSLTTSALPFNFIQFIDGFGYEYSFNMTDSTNTEHSITITTCTEVKEDSIVLANMCCYDWPFFQADTLEDPCFAWVIQLNYANALNAYRSYVKGKKKEILDYMHNYILNNLEETLVVRMPDNEYHYTLYYYNQAGNLVKTVPPNGVVPIDVSNETNNDDINDARDNNILVVPMHTMATRYWYNSLNQVVKEQTPDAGYKYYAYDKLGRITGSINEKQLSENKCSYIRYDELGRILEAGELKFGSIQFDQLQLQREGFEFETTTDPYKFDYDHIENNTTTTESGVKTTFVRTSYDQPFFNIPGFTPENLQNRVASVQSLEIKQSDNTNYCSFSQSIHYSYDIHGNVKTMIYDDPSLDLFNARYTRMDYDYDLISGNVNMVKYQDGKKDCWYHKYKYDEDNRIEAVYTSENGLEWVLDADYKYYRHGPLARTELGDFKVQGTDYAYTIQCWLKAQNSDVLDHEKDMGTDGLSTGSHANVARDAVGFSLRYFESDYTSIGTSSFIDDKFSTLTLHDLYNGNISGMQTALMKPDQTLMEVSSNAYSYDQLNRLVEMNLALDGTLSNKYAETYKYDPNGNILTLTRKGDNISNLMMDDLEYHYIAGTNKLAYVTDQVADNVYTNDFDGSSSANYQYDEIGNLVQDDKEEIDEIVWNVNGKITEIKRTSNSTKPSLEFRYDPLGNRVMKIEKVANDTPATWKYTIYRHDASGNIMATYSAMYNSGEQTWELKHNESVIYGSARLGLNQTGTMVASNTTAPEISFVSINSYSGFYGTNAANINTNSLIWDDIDDGIEAKVVYLPIETDQDGTNLYDLEETEIHNLLTSYANRRCFTMVHRIAGNKNYELTNHLGNVLAVITDHKIQVDSDNDDDVDYYLPDVISATDYYPFGSQMNGRTFSSANYPFGFDNKEKQNELYGEGNGYDFGARMYDARLGRWWSMDPYAIKYPSLGSFVAFADNPNYYIDKEGDTIVVPDLLSQNIMLENLAKQYGVEGLFQFNEKNQLCLTDVGEIFYKVYSTRFSVIGDIKGQSIVEFKKVIDEGEYTYIAYTDREFVFDPKTGLDVEIQVPGRHHSISFHKERISDRGGEVTYTVYDQNRLPQYDGYGNRINEPLGYNIININFEKTTFGTVWDVKNQHYVNQIYPQHSRLMHGIGHILYKKNNQQEKVINFDNLNRQVSGLEKEQLCIDPSHINKRD